jgi:hypothetical protein
MTESVQAAVFSSVTSMVTAAPVMFDEPTILHTVRIIDAASSLVGKLEGNGLVDVFLSEFRSDWEHRKMIFASEPDNYVIMLDEIAQRFVREAKKRNQTPPLEP